MLPNNSNIVLAAKQAAEIYKGSNVIVIESKTIGQGYAALSMFDTSMKLDDIVGQMKDAMQEVVTAEITYAVRDTLMNGIDVKKGDYIGIVGKKILTADKNSCDAVMNTLESLGFGDYVACIVVCGKSSSEDSTQEIERRIGQLYPNQEVYIVDGGQAVYDYILIIN